MSDESEFWSAWKSKCRAESGQRLAAGREALPRVREALAEIGVTVHTPTDYHWQFRRADGTLIGSYWPSRQKAHPHWSKRVHMGVTITQMVAWVKNRA